VKRDDDDSQREGLVLARELTHQAFSRASGAPLVGGNRVRLLVDAAENYPAWLEAIAAARHHVHFESYIIHDDEIGRTFAEALAAKARDGVAVRLVYDWLGCLGTAPRSFWRRLRRAGVQVRCYNPPRWDSPLGLVSRDHRKTVSVDGEVGFVSGLCVGQMWLGNPKKNIPPWRDTGVEVRGPSVARLEQAFAELWATLGEPIPEAELGARGAPPPAGDMHVRIVPSFPATGALLRVNELVAALARERLWLTDAYFAGTAGYITALREAARGGVDVRLLVPGASDVPLIKPLTRAGYRALLEAGVRVFEWNGPMLHAKTGVADSQWARVGSTNLNIASWLGNCELDVLVEDEPFACLMEETYLRDLENATEIVLDAHRKLSAPPRPRRPPGNVRASAGRAAAGAARIGNTVGAALVNRRVLEPVEGRLALVAGGGSLVLALLFVAVPRAIAWPLAALLGWCAVALLYRGYRLMRGRSS
jgi:cardiolipin synthase